MSDWIIFGFNRSSALFKSLRFRQQDTLSINESGLQPAPFCWRTTNRSGKMTGAMDKAVSKSSHPSVRRFALILGTIIAFGPLSIDLYLPALPTIARQFGTDTASAQLTLSVFLLGLMAGQAFYGPVADRFGRKIPLLVGCVLYTLASIGCAVSWSISSLTVWRFAQAIGGCAGIVIPSSIVRDLFDPRESARMYSALMLVTGLAPITAPLIGGQLLGFLGWRAIFWILAGFGLLCTTLAAFWLPETLSAKRRNTAGLSEALAMYGRLLGDRRFVGYALTGSGMAGMMFAYIAGSPFVVIDLYGISPQHYGYFFGANAVGFVALAQVNRRLVSHHSSNSILTVTLYIIAAAGVTLALVASSGFGRLAGLLIPLFVCIACIGLVSPNSSASAMARYGHAAGSAAALMGTLQFGVGSGAGLLVGALQNGTALPMSGVIALFGISALVIFRTLALRPVPKILAKSPMRSSD